MTQIPQTPNIRRRGLLITAGAASIGSLVPVWAQDGTYPNRPIRIILPIQPGGIADATMRLVAERLSVSLGQPVLIDNRPGGNYQIAVTAAANAPADGYILLGYHLGVVATQAVMRKYDLLEAFTQIGMTGALPNVLAVNAASPFKTVDDLFTYGKANPGKLNYATPGTGSLEHLKAVELERAGGFSATQVPQKGGPDMVLSLLRGECHFSLMPMGLAAPYASKGQLRFLAVVADERDPAYPSVPSLKDLGLKIRPMNNWMGLAVRKGTPAAVVQRLSAEVALVMAKQDLRQRLIQLNVSPSTMPSPTDFEGFVREELKGLAMTVASARISIE